MQFTFKVWHFIIVIFSIILLVRFSLLFNSIILFINYIILFFTNFSIALNQAEIPLIDIFISAIAILVLPVILVFKGRQYSFFQRKLDLNSAALILMIIFFIFAPLMVNFNPEFQKNIGVTKLLPPLSPKKIIHLKENKIDPENSLQRFFYLKDIVVKKSFDDNIIFADSVILKTEIIYYQNEKSYNLLLNEVEQFNGKPKIENKYFILGTDEYGRDIYSRIIYGTRISLFVGIGAVIITFIIGLFLGFLAGYSGGFIDSIISRITDMFLSFPIIFLIILILALFGNSLFTVILVLGFSGWMSLFKITRGEVISIKNKDYFVSAKMIGLSKSKLLFKEILPVILAPVIVNLVFQYGNVILAEAALSFLGLGTGGIYPSWGAMIEEGQSYLIKAWWMIFFPGLFLFITLLTANNLGRDVNTYFNPQLKHD